MRRGSHAINQFIQFPSVNQPDGNRSREGFCIGTKVAGGDNDPARGPLTRDDSGEFSHDPDANLPDLPVLALHQQSFLSTRKS